MMRFSSVARPCARFVTTATFGLLCLAPLLLAPRAAYAQFAADNASNTVYNSSNGGWQTNDNGGTGFMPWILTPTGNAGFFIANSNRNGGGSGNNTPNIGNSFGLNAVSGGTANALRNFASPLQQGQAFTLQFDNGFVATGSTVGYELVNSSGNALFRFLFTGGANGDKYSVVNSGGSVDTGIGRTGGGLDTRIENLGSNQYKFSATRLNTGLSYTGTGTLLTAIGGQTISGFRLFNNNAAGNNTGNQIEYELFANNLAVVPEPGTLALLLPGLGALGGLTLRARRRKR